MIDLASQSMSDAAKEAAVLLYSPAMDTFLEDLTEMPIEYSTSMKGRELAEAEFQSLSQGSEEPEDPGGMDVILWPRRQRIRPPEPRIRVNP